MVLLEANAKDRIEDVKLFFGMKIDNLILIPDEDEKGCIFYINKNRYVGGTIDYFRNISEILFYNYDSVWFTDAVKQIIEESKLNDVIPDPIAGLTEIVICFAKEQKDAPETKEEDKK